MRNNTSRDVYAAILVDFVGTIVDLCAATLVSDSSADKQTEFPRIFAMSDLVVLICNIESASYKALHLQNLRSRTDLPLTFLRARHFKLPFQYSYAQCFVRISAGEREGS